MKKIAISFKSSIMLLIVLCSGILFGQENQSQTIDALLLKADNFNKKYQDLDELKTAREAYSLAQNINDDKRKAKSAYYIARSLYNLGLYKESLSYIEKISSEKYFTQDPIQQALFTEMKAYLYKSLKLDSHSKKELMNVFHMIENNSSNDAYEIRSRTYANLAMITKNKDSVLIFYKLQQEELKKLPEKKYFSAYCENYSYIADTYVEKNKLDSAFYYLSKSYQLKQKYKDPVVYQQYISFGIYYKQKNEPQKALPYFLMAYENMEKYTSRPEYLSYIYSAIAGLYAQLGNNKKQKEFEELQKKTDIKILTEQNRNMERALNIILVDQQKELKDSETTKYIWIFAGILTLILIFIFVYRILRKNLKQKETLITEVHSTLQEKEEIITQKIVETEELQLKVNDAYNEVIELAKKNDPSFYFRFQEVYPDFQKKLLEYCPGLRTSELSLCAYTFLGFNVKDIADYTFKSVNTVRNRKQNLRKKFNLSGEQDMAIWLRNLTERKN